ncbi:hypothetical protein D3C87_404520 [compost metagenome]|uniref:hypothetical protein n=1 Tax=Achromobacter sp. Root83 TaxID=1736602 RepID=UPI00070E862D|nr:hypothetical protein [Achromobacter sp. Root83]KRC73262.1 hypothetical protein ASE30_10670 [Achromobacter sp. Root83]
MTAQASLSCLLLAGLILGTAHAGSAPAELSCVSDSGKVGLKGVIPSPSSEDLDVTLSYAGADLAFNADAHEGSLVVSDFAQSVFVLRVPAEGVALTLYALPASVAVKKNADGDVVGTFQAKLTAPRPRAAAGVQTANPLKATLNCDYRYSL